MRYKTLIATTLVIVLALATGILCAGCNGFQFSTLPPEPCPVCQPCPPTARPPATFSFDAEPSGVTHFNALTLTDGDLTFENGEYISNATDGTLRLVSPIILAGASTNTATATNATVAGGTNSTASGVISTVGGGSGNTASGSAATVAGGGTNTASGSYSTVPGGTGNTASGAYSVAAGRKAQATYPGTFVFADSTNATFTSVTTDTFNVRATGGAYFGTGGLHPYLDAVAKTASYPLTANDRGTVFTNQGATATITYTLPAAVEGLNYCFYVFAAYTLTVDPATGDLIHAITNTAGDKTTNATAGGALCLVATDTTNWVATSKVGTWADGN